MDAEKIHLDEKSCALCENKTGTTWKCCCPDNISELKSVSEERLRKRINLKQHQKLCQVHYKKLESGLLFGGSNVYQCCAPFHIDSPKKQNLKPVPYTWRSYFQSPSSETRYRTTQRICRECYMLAIEVINSETDTFEEEYNDLGYQSASFDLGYVSPKQWATNITRNQGTSPRSLSGSSWSLTPSMHSNSSVRAHRVSKYLKKDSKSGIGKLRKRLQMPENDKLSPTHSEPDLRLTSNTTTVNDTTLSKPIELVDSNNVSDTESSAIEFPKALNASFESTDPGSILSDRPGDDAFSDSGMESSHTDESCSRPSCIRLSRGYECTTSTEKAGDTCTRSEGVYVSKYIKFIYSDKIEREKEKILGDEDLDSDDSSINESQNSTLSDSIEDISSVNCIGPLDSSQPLNEDQIVETLSKYLSQESPSINTFDDTNIDSESLDLSPSPVKDVHQNTETESQYLAPLDLPTQRVSRGPTFYPIFMDSDVSKFPDENQSLVNNIPQANETIAKIKPTENSNFEQNVENLDYDEICKRSIINPELDKETPSLSEKEEFVNSLVSNKESNEDQELSSPFTFENDPAHEFKNAVEDLGNISINPGQINPDVTKSDIPKSKKFNDSRMINDAQLTETSDIQTGLEAKLEQENQKVATASVENKVKSNDETFVGLRRRPRNTMTMPPLEIFKSHIPDQKKSDNGLTYTSLSPVSKISENKQEDAQKYVKESESNVDKFPIIAKTGLYTELHGSKADEVEAFNTTTENKSSEENDLVPEILHGGDRLRDNERARQLRRRMQNRSQSLFQQDEDDSDDLAKKTIDIFSSFQTDQPALKRSIWREKRRKFGITFNQPTKAEDESGDKESEETESRNSTSDTSESEDVSSVLSDIFENMIAYITGKHPREEASSSSTKSYYITIGITLLLSATVSGFALLFLQ